MLFSLPSWDYFQCKSLLLECAVLIMTQKLLWLLLWGMISFCSNAQRNVLLPNCCSSQLICLFPQCQVQWGIPALGFIYLPEAAWGPWEGLVWGEGPPALLSSGISLAPLPQLWGHRGVPHVHFCPRFWGHCSGVSLGLSLEAPSALGPSWDCVIPVIFLSQGSWNPTPSGKCFQHPSTLGGVGRDLLLALKINLFPANHFLIRI